MNKVLVTGAAGFVGSAVVKELLAHNIFVVALDVVDDPSKRLDLASKSIVYFKADVADMTRFGQICKEYSVDTIYHFAWIGSAGPLREDYECQINNALNTVKLLETSKANGVSRFIVAGSIMEFEAFGAMYAQENKPQMPYIYDVGKQLAHEICKPVANNIGIELIWTYVTNSYGVGECSPRLINTTIKKCINSELLHFTSAIQNYDFIYIDDVARAFYLIGEKGKENKGYVVGSGLARPLKEYLKELVFICNNELKPVFGDIPFSGINLPIAYFSTKDLYDDCGFIPQISFSEGVRKTFEWLKEVEK